MSKITGNAVGAVRNITISASTMEDVARECLPDLFDQMKRYARLLHQPQYLEQMDDIDRDFVLRAASIHREGARVASLTFCNERLECLIDRYILNKPRRLDPFRCVAVVWHGVAGWIKELWRL